MIIIELKAQANGAHRNQHGKVSIIPEGWARVPPELKEEALRYLPFIELTIEGNEIVGIAQGEIPEPTPEPPEPPTPEERLAALEAENAMLEECIVELAQVIYA